MLSALTIKHIFQVENEISALFSTNVLSLMFACLVWFLLVINSKVSRCKGKYFLTDDSDSKMVKKSDPFVKVMGLE